MYPQPPCIWCSPTPKRPMPSIPAFASCTVQQHGRLQARQVLTSLVLPARSARCLYRGTSFSAAPACIQHEGVRRYAVTHASVIVHSNSRLLRTMLYNTNRQGADRHVVMMPNTTHWESFWELRGDDSMLVTCSSCSGDQADGSKNSRCKCDAVPCKQPSRLPGWHWLPACPCSLTRLGQTSSDQPLSG